MPRKSKSKKRKSRKTRNSKPSENANATGNDALENQVPDDCASIKSDNSDFIKVSDDSEDCPIPDAFLHSSPIPISESEIRSSSPAEAKSPIRYSLEISDLTLPARCKSADAEDSSDYFDSNLIKISSEHFMQSEMRNETTELLLTEFTFSRRPSLSNIFNMANKISDFLESESASRKKRNPKYPILTNRWKENYASDWFYFLSLFDTEIEDMKILKSVLRYAYYDFDVDASSVAITTFDDFYSMVSDFEDVVMSFGELLTICRNCIYKYQRFCATHNEYVFLRKITEYRPKLTCFYKLLKVEVEKFVAVREAAIFFR